MRAKAAAPLFALCLGLASIALCPAQAQAPETNGTTEQVAAPVVTIVFEPQSAVLPFNALASLDALATAMTGGSARVEIHGFAGLPGDLSSEARRLALRRCLSVRDYLVAKGIARERVILRPLGGASAGTADRADIFHVKR